MTLRFTLRQLEYFVATGRSGSLSAAARRLNISSPSLSAAIAQLEAEFGLPLFTRRHAQGLLLTEAGERLLERTARLLEDAAALGDFAADMAEDVGGPISIGCLISFAPHLMAPLGRSFTASFPEARVSLRAAHQAALMQHLDRGEIDVALTYDLDLPRQIRFEPLADLPPYAILPESHPLARKTSVTLKELAQEPMVLLDLPHSREYFLSLFHAATLKPRIAERCEDMAVLRSLVANGYGYGLINMRPQLALSADGATLSFIPLAGKLRPMILGLARKQAEYSPRTVTAFADHLRALLTEGTLPALTS
ncbi:MAG: LysR family transcriptional regulator [Pseudorhodobacter sp.]